MDSVQSSFYTLHFKVAFHSKKGNEFQDWFALIAGHAYGADFEGVRPYGPRGDLKCDGRRISTRTIFQCYAPYLMKEPQLVAKISEDFNGALDHWEDWMHAWILVHNDGRGLPPAAGQLLDELRQNDSEVKIETWAEPELLKLSNQMDIHAHVHVYGYAPSLEVVDHLALSDLVPIIDSLARADPDVASPPLEPPSLLKIEKNGLSAEAGALLQIGRRKSGLVSTWFKRGSRPDLGERIAQSFRERYALLKILGHSADSIFWNFQEYAGAKGDPQRQGAALAVITYFFDSCDIFEEA